MSDSRLKPERIFGFQEVLTEEHELLTAIVQRACLDVQGNDMANRRDARRWLLSDDNSEWTFLWICEHLKLSSKVVKRFRMLAISSNLDVH